MKDLITKTLTTATAALGGLGTYLATKGLIAIGDIDAVNGAGTSLGAALVVILGAVITHLLMVAGAKLFRRGAGEQEVEKSGGSGGTTPLILLACTAAALMGGLPSCTPSLMEAARAVPIRIGIATDHGTAAYSSKRGIEVEVDATSAK